FFRSVPAFNRVSSLRPGWRPASLQSRYRLGKQAVRPRFRNTYLHNVADVTCLFVDDHRLQPWRTADALPRLAPGLLDQQVDRPADEPGGEGPLLFAKQRLEALQSLVLDGIRYLQRHFGAGRSRPRRIFEREGLGVAYLAHDLQRLLEILLRLARKADDEIARHCDVGPGGADLLDAAQIVRRRVPPVHGLEHAIGAGLHRQVQIRHELRQVAMGGDQVVVHVARMARRVAQAIKPRNLCQPEKKPAQAPFTPVRTFAMPGVDVLAEKG